MQFGTIFDDVTSKLKQLGVSSFTSGNHILQPRLLSFSRRVDLQKDVERRRAVGRDGIVIDISIFNASQTLDGMKTGDR